VLGGQRSSAIGGEVEPIRLAVNKLLEGADPILEASRGSTCVSAGARPNRARLSGCRPCSGSMMEERPDGGGWRACVDSRDVSTVGDPGYALSSSSEDEHERLVRQADMYASFTRRLLERAGIEPGMRVLDVGCGPGDVSLLLCELVGADGSVVGVERDEQALARARQRAVEAAIENVEFVLGDFREVELAGGPFDALVGRMVLMYQGDPPAAVRAAARHVRPGGVVVFAEMCFRTGSAIPQRSRATPQSRSPKPSFAPFRPVSPIPLRLFEWRS
jgi:SAM-dependent methyltransferase